MNIIGVDPGKHGAISVFKDKRLTDVFSLSSMRSVHEIVTLASFIKLRVPDAEVFIEKVNASPQMGVVSAFTFGRGFGCLEGSFGVAYPKSISFVTPQTWQGALGCLSGGDKGSLYQFAIKEFAKQNCQVRFSRDEADAVLIGWYGVRCFS